ncbi:hypothetical protein GOV10_03505, partial [Candidatus Woesearchaeota archaeon]|nr:hypothetical protein [Candidatus Woesearchaeota archaeon]
MHIKNLRLVDVAKGQGFFIPVAYMADRMEGGLSVGKRYNLILEEVKENAKSTAPSFKFSEFAQMAVR